MRATPTTLENNHVRLTVEVDEQELDEALDAAAKKLSQQVSIKGFRKGKVPRSVLVAHLGGPQALRAEALRDAVPDFYARAVADTLIDPIAQPSIDIVEGETEGLLIFDADVEVRPEIEVVGYGDLRVTIPSPIVTDEEIRAQIDRMRETDAVLRDADRPIVTGDLVTMDVKVTPLLSGEAESSDEPFEMGDYMYTVGSSSLVEGVDELIVGMRAGEDLELNGAPSPGQVSTFALQLKKVQERELPELNDEWVTENTEWSSVQEMSEAIADQLRRRRVMEAQFSQRDATLFALSELVAPDVAPEPLVTSETDERLHDMGHRLQQQNLDFETFLKVTNQGPEQLLEALREDARRAVRVDLALRALVRHEGLEPDEDEVNSELETTAASMGTTSDVLRTNLRDTGRSVAFRAEVAKMKASRWLMEHVTYVDPEGVEIDRALLARAQEATNSAADEEFANDL